MDSALARFEADWLARLNSGANTLFKYEPLENSGGLHASIADTFVSGLGLTPIGFNWELLDAGGTAESPRSASAEITAAIANDIANPSRAWLGKRVAHEATCALIAAFDEASLTVVSNRYDGLWNPIAGQPVEWGFVLFDRSSIALLLITEA